MNDTIFALSSGAPPAAIAVVRISGPLAHSAVAHLCGALPDPRVARLRRLYAADGTLIDTGLVLWFPGPGSATGEDLIELHLHGGRAVVAAIEGALRAQGLRRADPGEFTRRAFANGRIDLAEAEGLADLLEAETELQRRQAISLASGALSGWVAGWRERVLAASAAVEAVLDFEDEGDVSQLGPAFADGLGVLADEIAEVLDCPRAEMLREGFRVVLAGPPNVGKSSLFNRLVEDEAAITAPTAGTTRDVLTRSVALAGIPFVFADTAGLRADASDEVEAIGIGRARGEAVRADLVLWLGPEGEGEGATIWEVESFADIDGRCTKAAARHRVSARSGEGIDALRRDLVEAARSILPRPGQIAVNQRQSGLLELAADALRAASAEGDPLLIAENLRQAREAFDRLLGNSGTEDMLDALFGRFCIGK